MKIAIINDTHFGARNDSPVFMDYFFDFFEKQFFPYLEENDITEVLHLGDLLDRRKYVNFNTLNQVRSRFFSRFNKINLHMILGNHDTFYRSTNKINSASELFTDYSFFNLYQSPQVITLDGLSIAMVPWICKENREECLDFLQTCNAPIVCGHLELNGYEVMRGVNFTGGMDDSIFSRFEKVLSGHFHSKSTNKNVYYLGTQYQITFSDLQDHKGFHVLDTETRNLEFVENKNKMFYSLNVDSDIVDFQELSGKMVKFTYKSTDNKSKVDSFVRNIENVTPYDFNIIESLEDCEKKEINIDLSKDTLTIINEEIDFLELDINKDTVKKIIHEVYMEALSK